MTGKKRLVYSALAILTLLAVSVLSKAQPLEGEPPYPRDENYIIGPGDILHIDVWRVPEISGDYRVGPDGMISMPLIGEVKAAGETRRDLADIIRGMLLSDYKTPIVSVQIIQYNSRYVYVLGRVRNPGMFVFPDEPTLMKAIALAGGVEEFPLPQRRDDYPYVVGKASILRADNSIIIVDLYDLLIRGKTELNVKLLPGDVVNVYKEADAFVYVMGEVYRPGIYELVPDMAVLDAFAMAGGYTKDAQAHNVRVVRNAGEHDEVFELDLYDVMKRNDKKQNIKLMAKDIVFMPVKGVYKFHYYVSRIVPSITTIIFGYTAGENLIQ